MPGFISMSAIKSRVPLLANAHRFAEVFKVEIDFMHRNSYYVDRGYFNYRNKFGRHETTMKMLLRCPDKYSPHLDGCKFLHNGIKAV
jgi:hypothetical protein